MTTPCQITVIAPDWVTGEDGTKRFFKVYEQFCYTSIVSMEQTGCECMPESGVTSTQKIPHYVISIDDEIFYIPRWMAIPDDVDRSDRIDKVREVYENDYKVENITDYVEAAKVLLGIEISYKPTFNGEHLVRANRNKNKNPGQ